MESAPVVCWLLLPVVREMSGKYLKYSHFSFCHWALVMVVVVSAAPKEFYYLITLKRGANWFRIHAGIRGGNVLNLRHTADKNFG